MEKQFTSPTVYFLQEGKENLRECLEVAFQSAKQQNVTKIIIFTAKGEGVRIAIEGFQSHEEFSKIKLFAVVYPHGKKFQNKEKKEIEVNISSEDESFFKAHNTPIVRAHLPFYSISPFFK